MKIKKYLSLLTLTISFILVSGCHNQPSNTINFTPTSPNSQFDTQNQQAIINVVVNDLRNPPEIASYVKNANIIKLSANPSVSMLFDQIIKQDLNSKGFRVTNDPTSNNIKLVVNITDFYANIGQGNLRYNINSKIQIEVKAQSSKGEFTKKFGSTRSQEGAFNADNNEIQKVLSNTLSDVTQSIYNDRDISMAINKYVN